MSLFRTIKSIVPLICRGTLHDIQSFKKISSSKNILVFKQKTISVNLIQNLHINCILNAKGKDIKKSKNKKSFFDEHELKEIFDTEKLFSDVSKPVEVFKKELMEHVSLRTSLESIQNVKVHFEGQAYTIQDLAQIGKKNPKILVLDFSSFPQTIPVAMETLKNSELNVNVQQDGTKVFVPIPRVTKEHRDVLAKKAKLYFTQCKENIRDVQMKYTKKLRNVESVSEETIFRITDQLKALADKHIGVAEEILKTKLAELLKTD